jgi:hypothetical protein
MCRDFAAAEGRLRILKWLDKTRTEGCTARAMTDAASNGHMQVVRWLHENRTEGCYPHEAMKYACAGGHLDVLQWLQFNLQYRIPQDALNLAAQNGHINIVEYLYPQYSAPKHKEALVSAAANGHLPVVEWLCLKGVAPHMQSAVEAAAINGQVHVLTWLSNLQKIPYRPGFVHRESDSSAVRGPPDLRWMHANPQGCTRASLDERPIGIATGNIAGSSRTTGVLAPSLRASIIPPPIIPRTLGVSTPRVGRQPWLSGTAQGVSTPILPPDPSSHPLGVDKLLIGRSGHKIRFESKSNGAAVGRDTSSMLGDDPDVDVMSSEVQPPVRGQPGVFFRQASCSR